MYLKWTRLLLIAFHVYFLAGCSFTPERLSKVWKVIKDPSIQVGDIDDRPSFVDIGIISDQNVNSGDGKFGIPLRFQIIHLTDDSMLMAADVAELDADLKAALRTNYLQHNDYTILPGQYKFIEPFELKNEVRYIGVIAFYQNSNAADWKKAIKVRSKGNIYHLSIHFRASDLKLQRADNGK